MTTYRLVMPGDLNHYGFLFGGKMLMWIDEVAWIAVSNDYPGCRFVTVGMSEVTFRKSVHPRAVLRFASERKRIGTTSVTYHVDVYRRDIEATGEEHVFHTDITFVRVDEAGTKIPVNAVKQGGVG
ncbi:MAG: acyl-CoA thioesterase [Kiritimatiellia bacterium]